MTPDYSWTPAPGALLAVAAAGWVYARRWRSVRTGVSARRDPGPSQAAGGDSTRGDGEVPAGTDSARGAGTVGLGADHAKGEREVAVGGDAAKGDAEAAVARAGQRRRDAPTWRLVAFFAGLAVVLVALVSPVDALADQLFLMHMVQHILLLDAVPILCILGFTRVLLRPVTRRVQAVERAVGPLAHPAAAAILYVGIIWLWHIPALYDATIRHPVIHVTEHLTFSIVGGLYWWHVLSPIRSRHRLRGIGPLAYMWSAKLGVGFLGVLLTFAPTMLYDAYANEPDYWGISPLTSQNVGGALMAIEQAVVMGIALGWLFVRMLNESEEEDRRAERFGEGAEAA